MEQICVETEQDDGKRGLPHIPLRVINDLLEGQRRTLQEPVSYYIDDKTMRHWTQESATQ